MIETGYAGDIFVGMRFIWQPEHPFAREVCEVKALAVDSDDEVWITSVGPRAGEASNSLEVFRESVVALGARLG